MIIFSFQEFFLKLFIISEKLLCLFFQTIIKMKNILRKKSYRIFVYLYNSAQIFVTFYILLNHLAKKTENNIKNVAFSWKIKSESVRVDNSIRALTLKRMKKYIKTHKNEDFSNCPIPFRPCPPGRYVTNKYVTIIKITTASIYYAFEPRNVLFFSSVSRAFFFHTHIFHYFFGVLYVFFVRGKLIGLFAVSSFFIPPGPCMQCV